MSGRGPRRGRRPAAGRWWAWIAAAAALVVLAGCQVSTAVTVRIAAGGGGTVTVAVTFDPAATAAVGGVESQLRTSDLAAEGWRQEETDHDGSTTVSLSHAFRRLSQVQGILDEVATDPDGGTPLFRLRVTRTRTFFRIDTAVSGRVDLDCGVSCFGDAALRRAYGSEVGVDPSALEGAGGAATAARDLPVSLSVSLPGRVTSSNAPGGPTSLRWTGTLGRSTAVEATATAVDGRHVAEASAAGSVTVAVFVVVIVLLGLAVRRRRTRRRLAGGRHHAPRR